MNWDWCWGRECKLGWGYDESLGLLIPIEEENPNVTSEVENKWHYDVSRSSPTDVPYWLWQGVFLFLEPSFKKFLDFQITFDEKQYWLVRCQLTRRKQTSENLPNYLPNCSSFINRIAYGVELWILFPKIGFPQENDETRKLFYDKTFNEFQKKVKCKVLINYDKIREMTLVELLNFMNELKEGKHFQYDIPVNFWYKEFTVLQQFKQNITTWKELGKTIWNTLVSKKLELHVFLAYLYCVYRKIEMKMEKAGYLNILPDPDYQEKSIKFICSNLNKANEEYKSMNTNDLLVIYSIFKRLFSCYTDYIRYSVNHSSKINEVNYSSETVDEMKVYLRQLNNWFPAKISKD